MKTHIPGNLFADGDEIRTTYPGHTPGILVARMACFGAHDVHMAKADYQRMFIAAPALLAALNRVWPACTMRGYSPTEDDAVFVNAAIARAMATQA